MREDIGWLLQESLRELIRQEEPPLPLLPSSAAPAAILNHEGTFGMEVTSQDAGAKTSCFFFLFLTIQDKPRVSRGEVCGGMGEIGDED